MIYLDNAASTRMHPDVLDAMLPFLTERYGNPSSIHMGGRMARRAVEKARKQVARLINADASEIFFTSGGTESNNTALSIATQEQTDKHVHSRITTSVIEHDAILEPCKRLELYGIKIEYIAADRSGLVDVDRIKEILDSHNSEHAGKYTPLPPSPLPPSPLPPSPPPASPKTTTPHTAHLVSIMYANNETGIIQPIQMIARLCRNAGALFHTDAVQAVGKIPVDVRESGIDLMSISSHKIHGPKGIGALYIRRGVKLPPVMLGGGQEKGLRSGTENVAGIVGFGRACEIALHTLEQNMAYIRSLRDMLVRRVTAEIPKSIVNGDMQMRLPGNAHFTFLGVNGEDLLIKLDEYGIAASTGSACSANTQKASHVLQAMGLSHEHITGSLRITIDSSNTADEINRTVEILKNVVSELRRVSPFRTKYSFAGPDTV